MKMNLAQRTAVKHRGGPALILAGPGSGKTAVITCRAHQLITQTKVPAEKILVVTFSRKAAGNMKERFLLLQTKQSSGFSALPYFGTFHSIFFMILRYAYGLSAQNIIRNEQKIDLLLEEADRLGLEYEETEEFFDTLLSEISCIKSGSSFIESFIPKGVSPKNFRAIYTGYSRALSKAGLIDFDDMLSLTLTLLKERPDILNFWQQRFRYILIDEFQDINPLQYEIIRLLALPENNLFVVGDDDQSIYAFRGASPEIMKRFLKDFPDARTVTLTLNYRCLPAIQNASIQVIRENTHRFDKNLKSACQVSASGKLREGTTAYNSHSSIGNSGCFRVRQFPDPKSQYRFLAEQIEGRLKEGVPPEEIAVLVRSSLQLPLLLHFLKERQIPVEGAETIHDPFRSFIGEDLAAYLRIAEHTFSPTMNSELFRKDFFRIINRPSRYITRYALTEAFRSGAESAQEILSFLSSFYRKSPGKQRSVLKLLQDLKMIRKSSSYAAVKYIQSAAGYEAYLKERALQDHRQTEEYMQILNQIEEFLLEGVPFPVNSLSESPFSKKTGKPAAGSNPSEEPAGIQVLTMHAAKGLEYSCVYLPDLNEDILPVKHAERPEQIEEERRVFYVAMTRASKSLEISFCEKQRNKKAAPSRFLNCFK